MLETYPGILRDSHIEWSGEAPDLSSASRGVRVHVTILDKDGMTPPTHQQGKRMADILERLAACTPQGSIPDPLAWERETRQDRPLPGRDDNP